MRIKVEVEFPNGDVYDPTGARDAEGLRGKTLKTLKTNEMKNDIENTQAGSDCQERLVRLREDLAEYAHEAWSGWMEYLFRKSTKNADGTVTIPAWAAERWERQRTASYQSLPEQEKESDREEADKMLLLLKTNTEITGDSPVN